MPKLAIRVVTKGRNSAILVEHEAKVAGLTICCARKVIRNAASRNHLDIVQGGHTLRRWVDRFQLTAAQSELATIVAPKSGDRSIVMQRQAVFTCGREGNNIEECRHEGRLLSLSRVAQAALAIVIFPEGRHTPRVVQRERVIPTCCQELYASKAWYSRRQRPRGDVAESELPVTIVAKGGTRAVLVQYECVPGRPGLTLGQTSRQLRDTGTRETIFRVVSGKLDIGEPWVRWSTCAPPCQHMGAVKSAVGKRGHTIDARRGTAT